MCGPHFLTLGVTCQDMHGANPRIVATGQLTRPKRLWLPFRKNGSGADGPPPGPGAKPGSASAVSGKSLAPLESLRSLGFCLGAQEILLDRTSVFLAGPQRAKQLNTTRSSGQLDQVSGPVGYGGVRASVGQAHSHGGLVSASGACRWILLAGCGLMLVDSG